MRVSSFACAPFSQDGLQLDYDWFTYAFRTWPAQVLIFVNSVDEAFRLRLFLESFGIRPALLNAELPLNSRSHILATFNRGLFDYLIATDDVHAVAHDGGQVGHRSGGGAAGPGESCLFLDNYACLHDKQLSYLRWIRVCSKYACQLSSQPSPAPTCLTM